MLDIIYPCILWRPFSRRFYLTRPWRWRHACQQSASHRVCACRGPRYIEVDIDVGSSTAAAQVTGLVMGSLKSLTIDLAVLLEGRSQVCALPISSRILSAKHASGKVRSPLCQQANLWCTDFSCTAKPWTRQICVLYLIGDGISFVMPRPSIF